MVYLDVYNSIFEYLEEIGIVDDVFEHAEEVMSHLLGRIKSNEMRNDMVAEFALFNYTHNGKMLIDFLSESLYPSLEENEKKEFDLISESERFNLKFNKKEKINELDTKGKELYDFNFHDLDNNETKVILSSTALDELNHNLNARLIKNPNHEGKHSIIGGIFDKKTFEAVSSLSVLKLTEKGFDEMESNVNHLMEFSKEHTLEEISNYKNEKSGFLEQDRKIMRINRHFFEKFKIGFDGFLKDFFEVSNTDEFIEMGEYYLSIADELKETIMETNYAFLLSLLAEKSLIRGFSAFIKKDKTAIAQCLAELKERGKKEFENDLKNNISLSRENIIKNNKKFLNEKVAPLKPEGFDIFIKKINNYSPEHIKEFLSDVVGYLENLPRHNDGFAIAFFTAMTKDLLEKADDIPYLNEAMDKQKEYEYIHEEFYDYIDADDEVYDLFVFLSAASLISNREIKRAYGLIKENKIAKTKSFDMMFLIGKIFSFFDDKRYKIYFNQAKNINKKRYEGELNIFLEEKEQDKLTL